MALTTSQIANYQERRTKYKGPTLSARLLNQPPAQVFGGLKIIEVRWQLASIDVLVVKPGIADRKDSALPQFCRCHNYIAFISNDRFCGWLDAERANFFKVKPSRADED